MSPVLLRGFVAIGVILAPAFSAAQTRYICIDPGHGGTDPGAVGCGLEEADINLETGLALKGLLEGAGYGVVMTRDTDVYVSLSGRTSYANAQGVDRFVSLHVNAAGSVASGIETYCSNNASASAVDLRDKIQAEMIATWPLPNRGGKTANFHVITNTSMPATLSEMGFINNCSVDATYLSNSTELGRMASAHLRAIQAHLGGSVPPQTGEITGVVFEDQGVGTADMSVRLPGATVLIVETGDQVSAAATTGAWTFDLLAGNYTVRASHSGCTTAERNCSVVVGGVQWCSIGLDCGGAVPDAGVPDSGTIDTGITDMGSTPDAVANDAGPNDGSTPDATAVADTGIKKMVGVNGESDGGCGCSTGRAETSFTIIFLLAILLLRRRGWLLLLLIASSTAMAAEPKVVSRQPITKGRAPVVSPDGKQLLFAGPRLDGLRLMSLESGLQLELTERKGAGYRPSWRLDSRAIRLRDPRAPFGENPQRLIDLKGNLLGPHYVSVLQRGDRIFLKTAEGLERISSMDDRFYAPILSPDVTYVAYCGLHSGIHLLRLSDRKTFAFGAGINPAFSARFLIFERTTDDGTQLTGSDLFLVDLNNMDPIQLTNTPEIFEQHPSLSQDGRILVYVDRGTIYRAAINTRR